MGAPKKRLLRDPEQRRRSVLAAIEALPTTDRADMRSTYVRVPDSVWGVLLKAALSRGMSVDAFIRRSAYAMAAHDLGIPVTDVLAVDPNVSRDAGQTVKDADGSRFGPWQIEKAVQGERSAEG